MQAQSAGDSSFASSNAERKNALVVAAYCATFLKAEMLHVYRQIDSLKRYRAVVVARKVENEERFPFSPIVIHSKSWDHELRRFLNRNLFKRPNFLSPAEARRLVSLLEGLSPDVVHIYFGNVATYLLPFLRINQLPTIISFHGADVRVNLDSDQWRDAMAETLHRATLILARSESIARTVAELGAAPDKVRIQRTGIPLCYLHYILREPPSDGAWRILQACRLIEKKGLKTTLSAFAIFLKNYPNARLVIAGEGPMLDGLQTIVSTLGISRSVDFTGFLDQSALREQYADSHIFVHPSETPPDGNVEGIPNSLLEAMATGLPVVSTRHGGIPEAVEDNESGFLVEERDADGVARALLNLARDRELYEKMSKKAAEAVSDKFNIRSQIPLLESHYDEAMRRYHKRDS